jgi:dTDP-glucose 4,6-dehydratase
VLGRRKSKNQTKKEENKMKRWLVTGGCGFIGHHFIEHRIKQNLVDEIVVLDKLTYASNGFDRLRDISVFDNKRIKIFTHDFENPINENLAREMGQIDYIVHMAAETHVDNSIKLAEPFVRTNVLGTMNMLEYARTYKPSMFLYFSTDEVFGPAPKGIYYGEWDRYNSANPYSASKAGGEELCLAYANSYKIPMVITHTMNVYGERQHKEKFIPLVIRKSLLGEKVTIHADKSLTQAGSRFYIHARNVANAIDFVLDHVDHTDKFNIVGEKEVDNLALAKFIAEIVGKKLKYEMVDFHSSRPGHDLRYALSGEKLKGFGWEPPITFEDSLAKTIQWYLANKKWLGL